MYDDIFDRFQNLSDEKQKYLLDYMDYLLEGDSQRNVKVVNSYIHAMHAGVVEEKVKNSKLSDLIYCKN